MHHFYEAHEKRKVVMQARMFKRTQSTACGTWEWLRSDLMLVEICTYQILMFLAPFKKTNLYILYVRKLKLSITKNMKTKAKVNGLDVFNMLIQMGVNMFAFQLSCATCKMSLLTRQYVDQQQNQMKQQIEGLEKTIRKLTRTFQKFGAPSFLY
ncbi:hypothetical protein ACJX0J_012207, partial [Zea mays]